MRTFAADTNESGGVKDEQGLSADDVVDGRRLAATSQLDAAAGRRLQLRLRLPPLQLQQPITVQQQTAAAGHKRQQPDRLQLAHAWK